MLPENTVFALPAGWEFQNDMKGALYRTIRQRFFRGHACATLWTG